ncbi:hypothetical protein CGRA01v4_01547 [Colletotrichum graminicola]|nr:hypothetical protein CGRA01v4_01547 [Colletotrichum graminicola]
MPLLPTTLFFLRLFSFSLSLLNFDQPNPTNPQPPFRETVFLALATCLCCRKNDSPYAWRNPKIRAGVSYTGRLARASFYWQGLTLNHLFFFPSIPLCDFCSCAMHQSPLYFFFVFHPNYFSYMKTCFL